MKMKTIAGAFVLFVILGCILMLWDKCKYARLDRHRRYYIKQLGCSPDTMFNNALFDEYSVLVWLYPDKTYNSYDIQKILKKVKMPSTETEISKELWRNHKQGYLHMMKKKPEPQMHVYFRYFTLTPEGLRRVKFLDEKFKTLYYKAKKLEESMSYDEKFYCGFLWEKDSLFFEYVEKYQRK